MESTEVIDHVFQRLRDGLVPAQGLDAYAVRVESARHELHRLLAQVERGDGLVKFLRGGYGCGKTFTARLATLDARARGFATSFVVVSENDLRFHKFDELYRKVVAELATETCPRGALGDILDRWIAAVEARLEDAGHDADADDFEGKVQAELSLELSSLTQGAAPADFARAVQAIFAARQAGDFATASALTSWLAGSQNVAAEPKRRAGIKGEIQSAEALDYLRGVVALTRRAGCKGLVVVVDEAETLLRRRSDVRQASLNGLRQIVDSAKDFPRLLWLFTGTPEFFESPRGVQGLAPLHDRIRFVRDGDFVSLRQAQLELRPFDAASLKAVALRLRALYEARSPAAERIRARITDGFVEALIDEVTRGFKGDVGVVPRQFLRLLVNRMDLVEEFEAYQPLAAFAADGLSPEERRALGAAPTDDDLEPATLTF